MEAEYHDFMSIEIDEGPCEISMIGLETRQNQLSSLSPQSRKDSDNSMTSGSKKGKVETPPDLDFKARLNQCMPFDFAAEEDLDNIIH